MLEMLIEASGLLIAGAILWAGREIHNAGIQIRRVSDAVESLDRRVSDLERVLSAERLRHAERRPSLDAGHEKSGSDSQGRS